MTATPQVPLKVSLRVVDEASQARLMSAGVDPLMARLYAARGVQSAGQLDFSLERLLDPQSLAGIERAATRLADAIARQESLLVIADYDCDGASACAVAIRGLRAMGALVEFLVPNRFETGYGLTPEIVDIAHARFAPQLIITVDNGIASVEGVARAIELGMGVLITDHHLPGAHLPKAVAIVNPNQPDCSFASKHLAGVGVIFYVLLALRVELRRRKVFDANTQPRLDRLLDLVALGTVADVVRLDGNNRLLVAQGLKRMREGRMQPGIAALFLVAGRDPRNARTADLGFALGPRINAAGRLADMSLGIACLITDDRDEALQMAERLSAINQERRTIEASMESAALTALEGMGDTTRLSARAAICVSDSAWHQGVVGILAGRLKERFNRPTVAFAPISEGRWRGSGRSIEGVHLRDVLDLVAKRDPKLILQFGGHAMAAGLTITDEALPAFAPAFERAVSQFLNPAAMKRVIEVDGSLAQERINVPLVNQLENGIWGQGFAAPQFCDWFSVVSQRILKDKHTKLALRMAEGGAQFDAIWFNQVATLPARARLIYRIATDEYNGATRIQLLIAHHIEEARPEPV